MKITGSKKLIRQLRSLPDLQKKHIRTAIKRNGEEGLRVVKTVVPVASGDLKSDLGIKYKEDGMIAIIYAGDDSRDSKAKAYSVEFGRKQGNRGTTDPQPYMRTTRSYLAKKFKGRIKRAINKAAKEAAGG